MQTDSEFDDLLIEVGEFGRYQGKKRRKIYFIIVLMPTKILFKIRNHQVVTLLALSIFKMVATPSMVSYMITSTPINHR